MITELRQLPQEQRLHQLTVDQLGVNLLDGRQHWWVLVWSCGGDAMTINIEWQDQFGRWHHYQSKQNQTDAYRVAQNSAESTGKRHRLVDGDGACWRQLRR